MEPNEFKPRTTPKDFFLYAGVMVLLYGSIISLINLLFAYINYSFPDQLNSYYDPFSGTIRWAMAFIIILFPAFLTGTWFINKDLRLHPEKDSIGIRKWLTYLALFIAGAGILVDLSVLVYTFLGGEITTRFILKVFAILVIAAYALSYYLLDLRGRIRENKKLGQIFGGVAAFLVLSSIVAGFFIVGSPETQRDLRFDQQRTGDLQNIQWQIVNYWQTKGALPQSLGDLNDSISGFSVPLDPEAGEPYRYTKKGELTFELCGVFKLESKEEPFDEFRSKPAVVGSGTEGSWAHGEGEHCFERVIDPDRYPIIDKVPVR